MKNSTYHTDSEFLSVLSKESHRRGVMHILCYLGFHKWTDRYSWYVPGSFAQSRQFQRYKTLQWCQRCPAKRTIERQESTATGSRSV